MSPRSNRPSVREVFLTEVRRPEVYFYTSNDHKFLQARIVFAESGLVLRHFRGRSEPYAEDYSLGRERLLTAALSEILASVGKSSLLFVEDTSLRIEALSSTEDFPGLAVKEWFGRTSFAQLDEQLRALGHNRSCVVKSDIALHVPGLNAPVFFHGETAGAVAMLPPAFVESIHYPWLTPSTFNGWFTPNGALKRLGEMDFEESCQWDFRVRSLLALIDRLEEYCAALNLPPQSYSRRDDRGRVAKQESLFDSPQFKTGQRVLVVVGRTCAGKSTFGERARQVHGAKWIEASSVMRSFMDGYDLRQGSSFELARSVLESKGYDAIARRIVREMIDDSDLDIVITGFRTFEELEVVKAEWPDSTVILVDATERTRFERHVMRRREAEPGGRRQFGENDKQQWAFGLLRVAEEFADVRINNEGALQEYCDQIDAILTRQSSGRPSGIYYGVAPRHRREHNQLYRCLRALQAASRPLSCDEIQLATAASGSEILHNNANKVLKRVPELARRLEATGERLRYEIRNAGRAYIRLMDALS